MMYYRVLGIAIGNLGKSIEAQDRAESERNKEQQRARLSFGFFTPFDASDQANPCEQAGERCRDEISAQH